MFVTEEIPQVAGWRSKSTQTVEAGMPMRRLYLLSREEMQGPEQGMAVAREGGGFHRHGEADLS